VTYEQACKLDPEVEVWRKAVNGTPRNIRIPGTRTWINCATGETVQSSGKTRPQAWAEQGETP
jgi:hypothetical protein